MFPVDQANKMHQDSVNSGNDAVQQRLNEILSTPVSTTTSGNTATKKTTKPSSVTNATQNDFSQMQQAALNNPDSCSLFHISVAIGLTNSTIPIIRPPIVFAIVVVQIIN